MIKKYKFKDNVLFEFNLISKLDYFFTKEEFIRAYKEDIKLKENEYNNVFKNYLKSNLIESVNNVQKE